MQQSSTFIPLVCIVDFHHARGPEIERWFGVPVGHNDPDVENSWSLLPFLALPDGAHASDEEFSYFTLRESATSDGNPSSLFGISCTRHIPASEVPNRSVEVTRSTIQKAVVAVVASPYHFSRIREQLSAITQAWFEQKDFTDVTIIEVFQESLVNICQSQGDERDEYVGLSLREMIHEYKSQILLLLKCCLLQPRMLFFGTHCEKMCLLQFSIISLIPGLLRNLQDCSDPDLNLYEQSLSTPNSLRTSERASLLSYMGLPLQLFGKGSLFGPYTPLQQLDVLGDKGTTSFIAGSTNSLLLHQKERYCDIMFNVDDNSLAYTSAFLKNRLYLSSSDRRWVDFLSQTVNETWDPENPTEPSTHAYTGSEEFLRSQFEEYILALLSSVKYRIFLDKHQNDPRTLISDAYGHPANDFGTEWVDAWMRTDCFRLFNKFTDSHLFDIVEPRHPCAGGMTIEDFQRRVAQQVADLHLDEHFNTGRELIGKGLTTGQKKVSYAINTLWTEIEERREAQRRRQEERRLLGITDEVSISDRAMSAMSKLPKAPNISQAQAQVQAAGSRAGAYLSSWGQWASEKRKSGWARTSSPETSALVADPQVSRSQGRTIAEYDPDRDSEHAMEKNPWS